MRKKKLDGNVFFLNRGSDGQVTKSPSVVKVAVDDFEDDIEGNYGVESATDNEGLKDPAVFKGRLNTAYLNAFLSMKYSEKATLDADKLNALRQAVGLPQQGTIVSKVDMFGNRYPLEDALKLFGAMSGKGAQEIKCISHCRTIYSPPSQGGVRGGSSIFSRLCECRSKRGVG